MNSADLVKVLKSYDCANKSISKIWQENIFSVDPKQQ